jgi:hypothetical protein
MRSRFSLVVAVSRGGGEDAAECLGRSEQPGALERDDDLGVVAFGELRQGVELEVTSVGSGVPVLMAAYTVVMLASGR